MMEQLKKLRKWMKQYGCEGVIISRRDNYTWISEGSKNHVLTTTQEGIASYIIWLEQVELVADSSDLARMTREQNTLQAEPILVPWYESMEGFVKKHITGKQVVSDTGIAGTENVQDKLVDMRMILTEKDLNRYRIIGMECAQIVEDICAHVEQGQKEMEVANELKNRCILQGISPDCVLVGSDERIRNYRHPMPTDKVIQNSLMVVLGGEKYGLNISLTRMVSFGEISEASQENLRKVQRIFATMQMMMREGISYSDYFKQVQDLYKKAGFPEEWKMHHQGGPTGYGCREFIAQPNCHKLIREGQAYAWNPTITGTKCEETTYLWKNKVETFTRTQHWPCKQIETPYGMFQVAESLVK
ncbi:MAG: M24 family metallopeptidase [Lachnospiraceae bacterium]